MSDDAKAVTLAECPIGLFMAGGELCVKTEYGTNEGRIDAYIVSSGEFFWGTQPQTIPSQRAQMVVPFDLTAFEAQIVERCARIAEMHDHRGDIAKAIRECRNG